ncbi:metal-dependent transcriptional regulator [Planctomonas sp. JC2975]|uniref:metal-dependent transcriptional regulator n=1 Tax=Planctomonas sp. JC2975 TaxID=2729626 RepID=UPI0014760AC5|nr:metal-dependent transcriptional regulator [Planctomonas sp. JC2975]NNC13911.1 metal-dependent transcriptional regulator [Planctomonas sp. JC2975]
MSVSSLTNAAQDYLKVIWTANEWESTPVTVTALAARFGVRAATVSDGIRRLTEQGLVVHQPYGAVGLTEAGRAHALAMVRRHRLIETFLVETLGYPWDEVHDEAEVLEHAVSDTLIDRIDAALGHPVRDPHGDPIPTADGDPRTPHAVPLTDAAAGERLTVVRISDADPAVLRYLAELGVRLDAGISLLEARPFAGDLVVSIDGGDPITAGSVAANAIWVSPAA